MYDILSVIPADSLFAVGKHYKLPWWILSCSAIHGTLDPTGLVMLVVLETTRLSASDPKSETSAIPPQHHMKHQTRIELV